MITVKSIEKDLIAKLEKETKHEIEHYNFKYDQNEIELMFTFKSQVITAYYEVDKGQLTFKNVSGVNINLKLFIALENLFNKELTILTEEDDLTDEDVKDPVNARVHTWFVER
jgi:hypothetical protein